MAFITKYWKYILTGIGICVILLIIGHYTGVNAKVYNMMLDQLRTDQSRIVENLNQQITTDEQQLKALQDERAKLLAERSKLQQQVLASSAEVARLRGNINALEEALSKVHAPADIDAIIADLHRLGFGSIRRR